MAERDPRVDPVCGDVLFRPYNTSAGGVMREVERAHGGFVGYYQDNGGKPKWKIVSLRKWRTWASKAEVSDLDPVNVEQQHG